MFFVILKTTFYPLYFTSIFFNTQNKIRTPSKTKEKETNYFKIKILLLIIIILYKKIVSKESNDIELYKYHRDELAYALLIYLQCYPKEEKISILKFHEQLERFNYLIMPEKDLLQKRMASILESTVSSTTRIWIDYLSFFFENLLKDGSIVLEELILQFSFFFCFYSS